MIRNLYLSINLRKIALALFIIFLAAGCDSGGDSTTGGGDNGDNNEPFVSQCDRFVVTIVGTEGDDNIIGTEGPDVIRGLGGNDTIDGRGGNDRICGDRGNDNLLGGSGIDTLEGGPGDDIVDGQLGDDIILEAPGSHDVLIGPPFNPQGPQTLDETSFTDAVRGIFLDITSTQNQVVDQEGNTVRIEGFFPNIYGSFHPDSFFFSNQTHSGAVGHVFDPNTGGNDVWVLDASGSQASVIPEISIFQGVLGPLQGDRTILMGDTQLNSVKVEKIIVHNGAPIIIDDGDSGYFAPGFTNQAIGGQGFDGDIDFSPAGDGNTATWTFSGLPNGNYLVSTTWDPAPDRATNSPFTLADGVGSQTVRINQELAPDDFQDEGAFWAKLSHITVTSNELTVTLTDDANQFVIADAIRIERLDIGGDEGGSDFIYDNSSESPTIDITSNNAEQVSGGFLGTQLEIPGDGTVSINLDQNELSDLEDSLARRNSNMFLVSTTYLPSPGLSQEVNITLTLDGVSFETTIDQTQIMPSFTTAPNGLTTMRNLFICKVSSPTFLEIDLSDLGIVMESDGTYALDMFAVTPVNKFELPFFINTEPDFGDDDQTCLVTDFDAFSR